MARQFAKEGATMKCSFAAFSIVAVVVLVVPLHGAGGGNPSGLSIAIIPLKDKGGTSTIDRGGKFQIVFTNQSDKPILLWSGECQYGYETLSFRIEEGDGMPSHMFKPTPGPSAWKNRPPKTIAIPPGETLAWDIGPADFFWGRGMWNGVPEPNTGKPITLTATLEIKVTGAAKEQGVWTGRVTSKPIKTLVVDAKFRTPHEYLWADCPKQALTIMQADRKWITKKDDMECTPLHHAARFGFTDVARWLLANGADVNAKAYNYFTSLHLTDDPEIVKLLIEHKANVNAPSNGGTALKMAAGNVANMERDPEAETAPEKSRSKIKLLLNHRARFSCTIKLNHRARFSCTIKLVSF
jgi:hypothetical protein